ncbi:hypothetical protein AAKU67_004054, partial [Oxalobacteraceae bacterium GrIS 2.11]
EHDYSDQNSVKSLSVSADMVAYYCSMQIRD